MPALASILPQWLVDWTGQDWRNLVIQVGGGLLVLIIAAALPLLRRRQRARQKEAEATKPTTTPPSPKPGPADVTDEDLDFLYFMYNGHRQLLFARIPGVTPFWSGPRGRHHQERMDEYYFSACRLAQAGYLSADFDADRHSWTFKLYDAGVARVLQSRKGSKHAHGRTIPGNMPGAHSAFSAPSL